MARGDETTALLLNHLSELIINDGTTDQDYYPIENVRVDENVPTDRIPLRTKRVYTQQDPDIDLSFTVTGTTDIVNNIYTDLGEDRESNGKYISRAFKFTMSDTAGTPQKTTISVSGILMGRTIEQQGPTGSPRMSARIRVEGLTVGSAVANA